MASRMQWPCAENWPPLIASADAKPTGEWTVVTRDDGKMMWLTRVALCTFKKDSAPGDSDGDGFLNGAWIWRESHQPCAERKSLGRDGCSPLRAAS